MSSDRLDRMIREWDGLAVVHAHDRPTGARIFIAIHDTRFGPAVGGTRMKRYARPEEALRDAMRLAEGMTYKWAVIDCPFGGGKSVIDLPNAVAGEERIELFRRYGRLLQSLRGTFSTGVDLGTDPADMDVVTGETDYVFGHTPEDGGTEDPGPFTALGVFSGIRAALGHRFGEEEPAGRSVLIQGAGDVGAPLARLLSEAGARVLVADLDEERALALAGEVDGETVPVDDLYDVECDVFAPCAVGGVLNEETIPRLRCSVVAGSANNQLDRTEDAARLHERGVLYAPDYVINAGGALFFALLYRGVEDEEEHRARVIGLGGALAEVFAEAEERGESPVHAARRLAERRLERAG